MSMSSRLVATCKTLTPNVSTPLLQKLELLVTLAIFCQLVLFADISYREEDNIGRALLVWYASLLPKYNRLQSGVLDHFDFTACSWTCLKVHGFVNMHFPQCFQIYPPACSSVRNFHATTKAHYDEPPEAACLFQEDEFDEAKKTTPHPIVFEHHHT